VLQNQLMVGIDRMVEDVSRWYLLHPQPGGLEDLIAPHAAAFAELASVIDTAGPDDWREFRSGIADSLTDQGVDPDLARRHAWQPELTHSPDIAQVARITDRSIQEVAEAFFLVGERLHIDVLEQRVLALQSDSRWERWAALAMEDDLMAVRREVAERVLKAAADSPPEEAVELYLATRSETYERLNRLLGGLEGDTEVGLAALTVALRQVRGVAA
jgi:glutamate dehydrogenase